MSASSASLLAPSALRTPAYPGRGPRRRACALLLFTLLHPVLGQEPTQEPPARPTATHGEDDDDGFTTLDTIVVSAPGGVPLTYAGGRDQVDEETRAQYPDGNIATLLRRVPGVFFLPENGNDSRIHVGIRGNDPRRSGLAAVLVDGIPICEAPYGNTDIDGTPIAMERIWRIDVVRGGGSIRYGPNSAGGIVNLLTEPVPEVPLLRLGSRFGSHGDLSESFASGGTWGRFGALASGVWKSGDGYRDNGEFSDLDLSLKLRYAISETETLSATVSRFDEPGAEQPGGLTQDAYDEDPEQSLRPGADFDFDTNRYVLQYASRPTSDRSFELKGWYQEGFRRLSDFRPLIPPFETTRVQESDFHSGALEGAWSWTADWGGLRHEIRHSARWLTEANDEFYYRRQLSDGQFVTPFDLNAMFRARAFSLFTEDVVALSEDVEWGVGFRAEDITMFSRSHDDGRQVVKNYGELLPETTLTWKVRPRTALYASYQRSFYPPQYETGFDPASVLYAPTAPESSDAYEVGVRTREVDSLECTLGLFDTEFRDKLDFLNTPDGKVPVNSGHARSRGVELGLSYDLAGTGGALDGLFLYGSLTAQRSTIESGENEGNDTPNAPHLLASWGAGYEHASSGLWARLGGSYAAESYKDLANTREGSDDGLVGLQPAYTLWDVAAGWHQRPDRSGLSLSVGVTNLLDEEYFRRFASGIYPGAPREAFVMLGYTLSF